MRFLVFLFIILLNLMLICMVIQTIGMIYGARYNMKHKCRLAENNTTNAAQESSTSSTDNNKSTTISTTVQQKLVFRNLLKTTAVPTSKSSLSSKSTSRHNTTAVNSIMRLLQLCLLHWLQKLQLQIPIYYFESGSNL
ncbi:uncharacterized protein LOC126750450 [Anthonomus grandis grandis]|uniref:uncharacterized protein LOC126750450 n=1 Tax=Anthonomus grandis grandis TaxID=2921223 RepID=UPI002166092F|nr:uncharacterized protein LOC126750450 [Anthonomus grandis grandis]